MKKILLSSFLLFPALLMAGLGDLSRDEIESLRQALPPHEFQALMSNVQAGGRQDSEEREAKFLGISVEELRAARAAEEQWERSSSQTFDSQASAQFFAAADEGVDPETQALIDQLQAQELQDEESRRQAQEETSLQLARELQRQEDQARHGRVEMPSGMPHPIENDEKRAKFYQEIEGKLGPISAIIERAQRQGGIMDVHAFNAQIKPHFLALIAFDDETIQTRKDHDWQAVHAVLEPYFSQESIKAEYPHALTYLQGGGKGHLAAGGLDPELGLAYHELLSRCWDLCLRLDFRCGKAPLRYQGSEVRVPSEFLRHFAFTYHENIQEKGGCAPGHAGRLARLYYMLIQTLV